MCELDQSLGKEFASYLSRKLNRNLRCKAIKRIFGGASRETYKVELKDQKVKESFKVIYRRSQKSSLIETDQETEFLAYLAFQNTPIPVPQLLILEKSSKPLGAPFLVMEEVKGEASSPFDRMFYKPYQKTLGKQFWSILGRIASFDYGEEELIKVLKKPTEEQVWKLELDYWVGVIREDSLGKEPILEAAIRELYRSPPQPAQQISLVHGDYRNGNFLIKKDKITAILDWEMVHLGDPLEDLGWALSPIWCWEENSKPAYLISRKAGLDIWKKESGLKIDNTALTWWELFSCVKGLAIWTSAGKEFSSGRNTDPVNLFSAWVPGDIHTEIILNTMESRFK